MEVKRTELSLSSSGYDTLYLTLIRFLITVHVVGAPPGMSSELNCTQFWFLMDELEVQMLHLVIGGAKEIECAPKCNWSGRYAFLHLAPTSSVWCHHIMELGDGYLFADLRVPPLDGCIFLFNFSVSISSPLFLSRLILSSYGTRCSLRPRIHRGCDVITYSGGTVTRRTPTNHTNLHWIRSRKQLEGQRHPNYAKWNGRRRKKDNDKEYKE